MEILSQLGQFPVTGERRGLVWPSFLCLSVTSVVCSVAKSHVELEREGSSQVRNLKDLMLFGSRVVSVVQIMRVGDQLRGLLALEA